MMGAPGALGRLPLNAEQKKKLLWGGKKAEPAVAVGGPEVTPVQSLPPAAPAPNALASLNHARVEEVASVKRGTAAVCMGLRSLARSVHRRKKGTTSLSWWCQSATKGLPVQLTVRGARSLDCSHRAGRIPDSARLAGARGGVWRQPLGRRRVCDRDRQGEVHAAYGASPGRGGPGRLLLHGRSGRLHPCTAVVCARQARSQGTAASCSTVGFSGACAA